MLQRTPALDESVRHLLDEVDARERIADTLYAIVAEVSFGPRDIPHDGDVEWVRGALALPLHTATEAALEVLVEELETALTGAPTDLLHRIEESHRGQDLGWE